MTTVPHHSNPVTVTRYFGKTMSDENAGYSAFLQQMYNAKEGISLLLTQRCSRLVENNNLGILNQDTRKQNHLFLGQGQLGHFTVNRDMICPELFQCFLGTLLQRSWTFPPSSSR
ncbi:hypothetical protein D3C74_440660 [compost metagenome]